MRGLGCFVRECVEGKIEGIKRGRDRLICDTQR